MFTFSKLMQTMSGTVSDPYFNQVTLLLNTTSTDGAKNNTFQDSSSNGYTITRNPATGADCPTQGTFTPFSQTGWSNYFGGNGNYLTIAVGYAGYNPGATGEWTLECWIYPITSGAFYGVGGGGVYGNSIACYWNSGTTKFSFLQGNGSSNPVNIVQSTTSPAGAWYHYAVSKDSSNVIRLFINGVQVGTQTYSSAITSGNRPVINGVNDNNGLGNDGTTSYISNLRWVKGGCLYPDSAGFTPPTAPLTANVSSGDCNLLFAQSNRFVDNSTASPTHAIGIFSPTGTPSVQAFSPFAPTAAYDTSVVGGSLYNVGFTGLIDVNSNSNLTIASSNFTIAFWAYFNSIAASAVIFEGRSSAVADAVVPQINFTSSTASITYRVNGSVIIDGTASFIKTGQWYYIVLSRLSGTTRLFINGAQQGSDYTDGNNYIAFASDRPRIGNSGNIDGPIRPFFGYVSGLQVLVGTGTSAPVTPTAPPTSAVANTQLLLNFTNAGIYDAAAKIDLETVGNAQVSTTQAKFGTTSIYLDGGYLYQAESNTNLAFDSSDFTIEFFIRLVSTPLTTSHIIDMRPASTNGFYPNIQVTATRTVLFVTNSGTRITSAALSINVWTYVALIKSAGETKLYFNGVQTGSTYVDTNTYLNSRTVIGASSFNLGNSPINAYFDEFRFTKGLARTITLGSFPFSTSTAAPTEAFPIR